MFEFIKRSIKLSGRNASTLKGGMFFVFIKDFAMLLSFSAVYLSFLWMDEMSSQRLWMIFGILFISFVFSFFANWMQNKMIAGVAFKIYNDYRLKIGDKLKKAPMGYFNEQSLSKILACFTNIMKSLENLTQMAFSFTISGMSVTFFILFGMFMMSIKMGLLALVLVMIAWLFIQVLFTRVKREILIEHQAEADFNDALLDGIRGIPVLRSFPNLGKEEVRKIHSSVYDTSNNVRDILQKFELTFTIYSKIFSVILSLSSVIMTIYACYLFNEGEIEIAQALTLCVASFMLFAGMRQLENASILLVKNPAHLDYLEEVLDVPQIVEGESTQVENHSIDFKNVHFAYDQKEVIKDLSFTIKEGSKTAIVGPSGGGKSTMIHLMARFYDVDKGGIYLGGKNIKEYEVDTLLKELSLVFQDVYLFSDTIKNNIRFAKPEASDEEIMEVAKKAMCHDFIMALPDGYDTLVGEGGSSLSGGEKQRISIARALLKNASIILLDEATSSVDPENEYEIMKAIDELTKDKTVISIAHRLSTVKHADQILVIDDGKLIQEGTHDMLMKESGIYKSFIEARDRKSVV